VIGDDLVAFEGVAREAFLGVQVAEGEVDFYFLGVYIKGLFIEGNGLGRETVLGENVRGLLVGVDSVGLRVFFQAQVADGVVQVGVVRRLFEKLSPLCNRLVILALGYELLGFFQYRIFVDCHRLKIP